MEAFLSVEQVAQRWNIEPTMIVRLAEEGILQAVQEGEEWRFPTDGFAGPTEQEILHQRIERAFLTALREAPSGESGEFWLIAPRSESAVELGEALGTLPTFSAQSVSEGIHFVGGPNVSNAQLPVLRDYRHQLSLRGNECHILNPPDLMMTGDDPSCTHICRARIRVRSESGYAGPLRFTLSSDAALSVRTRQHADVLHGSVIELIAHLDPAYAPTLFDGAILALPEAQIFVTVPQQEGLTDHIEDVLLVRDDFRLDIVHQTARSIRERTTLKFEFELNSDSEPF